MFTADANITDLKVKERGLFKMLFSMNIHQIATPELSVEDARCYIIFFSNGPSISAFIGLYLPRTDRRFYYTYSANPFPYEASSDVEDEARMFAEDMGFVMDEINIAAMSAEERGRWLDEQAIFGVKKPQEPEPDAQPPVPPVRPVAVAPQTVVKPQPAPIAAEITKPEPQRVRPAAQPAVQSEPRAAEPEPPSAVKRHEDVLQQAVRAGVVKPMQQKLKKEIHSANDVVSRDKEALARLLASF